MVLADQTITSSAQAGWGGNRGTSMGCKDLEKDEMKSKRNGRSRQTAIRTRESFFVVLV